MPTAATDTAAIVPQKTVLFRRNGVSQSAEEARFPFDLLRRAEELRVRAAVHLSPKQRSERGQFLTPPPVASLMASMLTCDMPVVSLLDAGAGVGSLFAAVVDAICRREIPPEHLHIVAYEIEPLLADSAEETLRLCRAACEYAGIAFSGEVRRTDFLCDAVRLLETNLLQTEALIETEPLRFTCAIQNPPYRKINNDSDPRLYLRRLGIETTNLYTGFLYTAMRLLSPGGELVAVTPRSFCNGRYFRPFREAFLQEAALTRLHLFETRQEAFKDDAVLQETLILRAVKTETRPEHVTVTTGHTASDEVFLHREVPYTEVVRPDDPEQFIRVVPDEASRKVAEKMARFQTPLDALGLQVSTGRVVDFRAAEHLRIAPDLDTAPLIWPLHLNGENGAEGGGYVQWPRVGAKKPNALVACSATDALRVPNGNYVLVKRFSAKEQKKRITAAVYEGGRIPAADPFGVGFENHLNYFHTSGTGFDLTLARGLAAYLNATLVDEYFRQHSGHTQVNATDLRNLRYPTREELCSLGSMVGVPFPTQDAIDQLIEKVLRNMTEGDETAENLVGNPVAAKKQIAEALLVLKQLGLPAAQQNERSALTLLALLDLRPGQTWAEASHPLRGITPIMDFIAKYYGKTYAPNTRETVRRFTVHQFIEAGLLIANPDAPERPVNSPRNVYQVTASALDLFRTFGTAEWERDVEAYLATVETLKERYARERRRERIPVEVMPGQTITLSPGGQNILIERIIADFCPYHTPGAKLLYVGDTEDKFAYFDRDTLLALGVTINEHGKMPDVIVHHVAKNWLVLIEAVTSHGPVNAKRHAELTERFAGSSAGLVFVTAFLTRKAFLPYLQDISWETEVWLADAPTHLIHFDGAQFLGPY
jgi:adenine-specific DNA-methyltransferase